MTRYMLLYAAVLAIFLVIDMIWLRFLAKDFYASNLAGLLREKPVIWAAGLFYLLYPVGLVIFGILKSGDQGHVRSVFISGALFGFFCYFTYDATNYAIAKNFPLKVAIVDTLWGAFVSATTCALAVMLLGKQLKL